MSSVKKDNTTTYVIIGIIVLLLLIGGGIAIWWFMIRKNITVGIEPNKVDTTLPINETIQFNAVVKVNGVTDINKKVNWTVDNASLADIDDGELLPLKDSGTVKVIATSVDDTSKSATVIVSLGPAVPFFIKHQPSNKCLGRTESETKGFFDCDADQKWDFTDKTLRHIKTDKCLDTDGDNVFTVDCGNGLNQQWKYQIDKTLLNETQKKCLDSDGTNFSLKDCNNDTSQQWNFV